ncbi:hypothetical protein MMC34_007149 [Xylographa carneopallida]|nr:hypothetical protein [Xylographa carneopallida]
MYFSTSALLSLAACCGVLHAAAIAERGTCNADNCLRGLNGYSSTAAFCASYTTVTSTAATGLPTFATQCTGLTASCLSSACSCYAATATTSSHTSTTTSTPTTTSTFSSTTSTTCTPVTVNATATAVVTHTATQAASALAIPPTEPIIIVKETETDTETETVIPAALTLTATDIVTQTDVQTEPISTVTITPDASTVAATATLPPITVTVTATLPATTVTVTAAIPAPTGDYSLGFGFDPLINYVSDNLASLVSVQDPTNAYARQSYLSTINSGDVAPQITTAVQTNANYVADRYTKKGLAAGTCTVAIAVLNAAGTAYLNFGSGGTYHIHTLTTAYTYDSTAFNTGANA